MSQFECHVIGISGYVGSGKSTVAARLSELLGNVPILAFDDYEQYAQWPQDMRKWLQDGADPDEIRVPRLRDDLVSLLGGRPIEHPLKGSLVHPARYIILEEPSGRQRQEIGRYIDLLLFIDVPQDVCVVRMVERVLDMEVWDARGTFAGMPEEDLARQLDLAGRWVRHYGKARPMYISGTTAVRQNSDAVIDGMRPVDEIALEALDVVHARLG